MKRLLVTTAVLEAVTGLGLLAFPSVVVTLILGSPLDTGAAVVMARVAGMAILALATACWLARQDEQSRATRGLVSAMVLYNAGIIATLVYGVLYLGVSSIVLWPIILVHAAMGAWCVACLLAKHA
jgi:hypothetical protein